MKKIILRILLIIMFFSLSFGSTGITMPKATEDKGNEKESTEILGPEDIDHSDTPEYNDNLEDYEIDDNFPSFSPYEGAAKKKLTQCNINPIIVLIDFPSSESDSTKGKLRINSTTYNSSLLSDIKQAYSGESSSLKDYISKISYGKCSVNPYYAYNKNNRVYVYRAEHPKEYYMPYNAVSNPTGFKGSEEEKGRTQLLIDAFASIKDRIPKNIDLDANDDGYIDAAIFFVPYQNGTTFFWPHRWSVKTDTEKKTEVNGAVLNGYNIITKQRLDLKKYRIACHEFLHILGFKDMYAKAEATFQNPIGKWTMMSDDFGYTTVRERIKYGEWVSEDDIPTINKPGRYTLKGSTLDSTRNTIAYKVQAPDSDEYFMIEYRDKTANVYENSIPHSGIIVYRVDPHRNGNLRGNSELYILRNEGQEANEGYLDGTTGHKSVNLVTSDGKSSGYSVEFLRKGNGEADFKLVNNNTHIYNILSTLGTDLEVGDTTSFRINAKTSKGTLKYSLYVAGKYLLKDSTSCEADWTPNKAGTYTVTATVVDSENNVAKETRTINVKERNETTIYYKGYNNPYIHYRIGNGNWTNAPGVKMVSTSDIKGYDYKAVIKLNGSKTLTACFNDGNGNWDSNNGQNYTFNEGYYTYSEGRITKVPRPEPKISIDSFNTNPNSEATLYDYVTLSGTVNNNEGAVTYTFEAKDSTGKITKILENSTKNTARWKVIKEGKYTLIMTAKDSKGNIAKKEKAFKVNSEIKLDNVSFNKTSPIYVGDELNVTVSFSGGTGKKKCISIRAQGGNYITGTKDIYFKMNNDNNGTWKPDMDGTYELKVTVQDESGCISLFTIGGYIVKNKALEITSIASSKGTVIKTGTSTELTINAVGGKGKYTYDLYTMNGIKMVNILKGSTNNRGTWSPTISKDWSIVAKVTDEAGNTASKTINITSKDIEKNITTIYYNGYENPYIHYQIGNGSWTSAPGVKMTPCTDVAGYNYKVEIDLGDATNLTACFNNGSGSWDNNNGSNYKFGTGYYTCSNGKVTKIDEPNTFSISSSAGDVIKTNTETTLKVNVKGGTNIAYSVFVNGTKILNSSSSNTVKWKPTKAGIYKISATVSSGRETVNIEKTITVKDVTSNVATIYYKGYDNPYIHYQIGNGQWTSAPGIKMTPCTSVSGYNYKAEIDLKDATILTACFNNGNGSWDSNNGQNYRFGAGSYTFSNGVITKINN